MHIILNAHLPSFIYGGLFMLGCVLLGFFGTSLVSSLIAFIKTRKIKKANTKFFQSLAYQAWRENVNRLEEAKIIEFQNALSKANFNGADFSETSPLEEANNVL